MPLIIYLKPEDTFLLKGSSRQDVLIEMIDVVCLRRPDLDPAAVHRCVAHREDELNTSIAPGIALPHARIPKMNGFIVAVGLSPQGVSWGRDISRPPVHIVTMVLGDDHRADEHIRILGQIASLFAQRGAVDKLVACQDADALFEQLLALEEGPPACAHAHTETQNVVLLEQASKLGGTLAAGSIIVLGPRNIGRHLACVHRPLNVPWVLAAPATPLDRAKEDEVFDSIIDIPYRGLTGRQRVDVVLLIGLLNGVVQPEDLAICVYGRKQVCLLDTVYVIDPRRQFGELLMLRDKIRQSDINPEVLYRVLQLTNEIAIEGREGHPIGTLFVLGDYEHVAAYSHQIVINPFRGYSADEKNILDPILDETLKEFALLDGAFVVRGDGEVMSAGTCIQISTSAGDALSGLGTRHAAGVAISAATSALAVVLSQSTGTVSMYKSGKRILALTRRRE